MAPARALTHTTRERCTALLRARRSRGGASRFENLCIIEPAPCLPLRFAHILTPLFPLRQVRRSSQLQAGACIHVHTHMPTPPPPSPRPCVRLPARHCVFLSGTYSRTRALWQVHCVRCPRSPRAGRSRDTAVPRPLSPRAASSAEQYVQSMCKVVR